MKTAVSIPDELFRKADRIAKRAKKSRRKQSVANVSQIVAIDRALLSARAGKLPRAKVELLFSGIDLVLGR